MSQENLLNAVISSNIDEIVNLLKSGVEVTKDIVSEADKTLKEFEKQSKKNKALLNDTTIEHTNQYRIYKMLFLYMKGYELKSILTTYGYNVESKQIENKQKVKNKKDLIKMLKDDTVYLGSLDISKIDDFSELFKSAKKRKDFKGIDLWDTKHVKDMSYMFAGFDFKKVKEGSDDLYNWIKNLDVSNVENMAGMFFGAKSFNQDISSWNVSSVKYFDSMFSGALSFNQNINNWNVSNAVRMNSMFRHAESFNQPLDKWNVSNVSLMGFMFYGAVSFNQDISMWDTTNVEYMRRMFDGALSFNQNIDNWNISSLLTNIGHREELETNYYENEDVYCMYAYHHIAPKDITINEYKKVVYGFDNKTDLKYYKPEKTELWEYNYFMFKYAQFDCPAKPKWLDIPEKKDGKYKPVTRLQLFALVYDKDVALADIDISEITDLSGLFYHSNCSGDIDFTGVDGWDTAHVKDMSYMFYKAGDVLFDINNWNVSNVENMERMFSKSYYFNKPLHKWDTAHVKNMSYMFAGCEQFHQNISNWNVSNVENMEGMFYKCRFFNYPLNSWDVSKVTNMSKMFSKVYHFNQPLDKWDVSSVTNMESMFYDASNFNRPLNDWNVSKVENMSNMFCDTDKFNQPLDKWDVSNVKNMRCMFNDTGSFNQPLNSWNVSNVENMHAMFAYSKHFNQPLDKWDVSNVKYLSAMFLAAYKFNQPIDNWSVPNLESMKDMFGSSSEKTKEYMKIFGIK